MNFVKRALIIYLFLTVAIPVFYIKLQRHAQAFL